MNTYTKKLRKIKNNSKALSPVVASIILIAVTVAVSVVVAAWLSGTAFSLMGNAEQVTVSNPSFNSDTEVDLTVRNTGGATITLQATATVDGQAATLSSLAAEPNMDVPKGTSANFRVTLGSGNFTSGAQYQLQLTTAKGTTVMYTVTYNP
jgi:flagellin-like protein